MLCSHLRGIAEVTVILIIRLWPGSGGHRVDRDGDRLMPRRAFSQTVVSAGVRATCEGV